MTVIAFQPDNTAAPPFQVTVTLDGVGYSLQTAWNFYGKRWYFSLTDQGGNVLIFAPLIGSPLDSDIFLAPGLFSTSTLLYREASTQFEVTP